LIRTQAQACEHFKKLGKKSFSVTRSNAVNALDDAETVLNETEVKLDFIFFDMPGTIKSEGVMKTLSQMDYIFVPVSADRFVVESAMSFMQLFHDNFLTQGWSVTKKLAFFWTMVDKRERTSLYDVYEGMFKSLDYSVLNTRLPDSKRFRRELSENRKAVFRSTIFPSDPNLLRGSGIKELSDEICEIIKT
jgi:cellulose biosynthesis protein BcsQ